MERITLSDGRVFVGKRVIEKQGDNCKIYIYLLRGSTEKYFVLRQDENSLKIFHVTGSDKIDQILAMLEKSSDYLQLKVESEVKQIEKQCTVKSLKRVDSQKHKEFLSRYYDKNYSKFIVLGNDFSEFIMANQKAR